jgi:putative transposase
VVIDTIEVLFAGLEDHGVIRSELRRLFRWLKDRGVTAIITAERGPEGMTRHGIEEYLSDCVIVLDQRIVQQISTRRLRIVKYRGSNHGTDEYPFLIDEGGLVVFPITSAGLDYPAPPGYVSSGIRTLAGERRRFGYRRLHELLRREGWRVNHKRIERLYREEKLAICRRGRQKRGLGGHAAGGWCPIAANQRWSLDFTEDCLANGRQFRTANLKDDCTRECPAIAVAFSLPGRRVVAMLDAVAEERGYPDMLVVDNGPELRGRDLDRWAHDHGVKLFFIDPGKPMQNGSIESFNGRFREECLDQSWFTSLAEARRVIEAWRIDYNLHRPQTSLHMATPAAFAAKRPFVRRQRAPAPELCGGSPPEPVAALTPPVLSGTHGFP